MKKYIFNILVTLLALTNMEVAQAGWFADTLNYCALRVTDLFININNATTDNPVPLRKVVVGMMACTAAAELYSKYKTNALYDSIREQHKKLHAHAYAKTRVRQEIKNEIAKLKKQRKNLEDLPMSVYKTMISAHAGLTTAHDNKKRINLDNYARNFIQNPATVHATMGTAVTAQQRDFLLPILEQSGLDASKIVLTRTQTNDSFCSSGNEYHIIALGESEFAKPNQLKFICGHEATHAQPNDAYKRSIVDAYSPLVSFALLQGLNIGANKMSLYLQKKYKLEKKSWAWFGLEKLTRFTNFCANSVVANLLLSSSLQYAYSRWCEKRADLHAAQVTGDAQSGATLFQTLLQENPKNTSTTDRYGNRLNHFEHPPLTERIAYLTAIAQQQTRK